MTIKAGNTPQFKSMEEERDYWEARGPLGQGYRSRLNKPARREQLTSFLSVRLSDNELTQLRDLAAKCDCGPSTLARRVLVVLLEQVIKASTKQDEKAVRTITIEEVCEFLAQKLPETLTQKAETLFKSAEIGGASGPSFLLMDAAQFESLKELGAKLISSLLESTNPNIRVVTPYDANYDKVRATLGEKDNSSDHVKV
jgi:hypothetical protein